MIKRTLSFITCLVIHTFLFSSLAGAQAVADPSRQTESAFNRLVDQYFDFYFKVNPTTATQTGFHQYDSQLEDFREPEWNPKLPGWKDSGNSSVQSREPHCLRNLRVISMF